MPDPRTATPVLNPAAFAAEFDREARARGFRADFLAEIAGVPLHAYVRPAPAAHPKLYLSSGVHGDEPAPPQALLELLRRDVFDDRAEWYLVPMLNPTGFIARTRENSEGIDLNRDYREPRSAEILAHTRWLAKQPRFDVTFCLHEDYEAAGFYLYEVNTRELPSLAATMLAAAAVHSPIEQATVIDGREASGPGLIRPSIDPILREGWPEALFLREHHTHLGYTLETASAQPITQRVATTFAAISAALSRLLH
jgi:protein MpaA